MRYAENEFKGRHNIQVYQIVEWDSWMILQRKIKIYNNDLVQGYKWPPYNSNLYKCAKRESE